MAKPTPWHKDEALGHFFYYRVRQLLYASKFASSPLSEDASLEDKIKHNAFVESYLIHARALFLFLTNKERRYPDDVFIKDYGIGPLEVVINPNYKSRLDKDLAHFTYSENVKDEQKQWHDKELVYPILLAAKEFIEHVLQHYSFTTEQATQFIERLEQILEQIDEYLKTVK
jgi:hypothetical protein